MPKFKVWFYQCYDINVEAENREKAFEAAYEIPLDQWWSDQWGHTEIEEIDELEESENV
jgi:hypothetical protein